MTREQVWRVVAESLREGFGRLLDVRDVRRVRRVSADAWVVTVALAAPSGDLHVADVSVDSRGVMDPVITADVVIDAVRRARRFALPAARVDEFSDLGDAASEDDEALGMLDEMQEPIETRAAAAILRGDPESLGVARELLPRKLADHDRRGATLFQMAEVEVKLGEPGLAKGYLEAAAREFADRFDLPALERAAAFALLMDDRKAFGGSPVYALLAQSRTRLSPLASLFDARSLAALSPERRAALLPHAELRTLAPEEMLVTEGEPSCRVFVVKSGLLGVWLEKPDGATWMVRSCFPGWLLGESSVLELDARCTASLRAERVSEVWSLPADRVRAMMAEDEGFAQRIAETKHVHRIDSFFSMHETMGQLDVQVRDEILSCIQRLESFEEETVLIPPNVVPDVACLVARGTVALFEAGRDSPSAVVEADSFYGVRDAIHRIASTMTAMARPPTTIAFFDAARLQQLCQRSPPHVVAVLERLG